MRGTHTLYSRKRDAKKTGVRKVCHEDKLAEEAEAAAAAAIDRRGEEVFLSVSWQRSHGEWRERRGFFAPTLLPPPVFCPLLSSTSLPASLVSHRSRGGLRRRRRGILRLSQRPTRAHSWTQGGRKCVYGTCFRKPHAITYANLDKAVRSVQGIRGHIRTYVCNYGGRACTADNPSFLGHPPPSPPWLPKRT